MSVALALCSPSRWVWTKHHWSFSIGTIPLSNTEALYPPLMFHMILAEVPLSGTRCARATRPSTSRGAPIGTLSNRPALVNNPGWEDLGMLFNRKHPCPYIWLRRIVFIGQEKHKPSPETPGPQGGPDVSSIGPFYPLPKLLHSVELQDGFSGHTHTEALRFVLHASHTCIRNTGSHSL